MEEIEINQNYFNARDCLFSDVFLSNLGYWISSVLACYRLYVKERWISLIV